MYCHQCGRHLPDQTRFCTFCGSSQDRSLPAVKPSAQASVAGVRRGYSEKITDPAFSKYMKNTNRWAMIFSCGLAVIAIAGFSVAGALGVEGMENPQAFFQGLGIGAMFIVIGIFSVIGRKRSTTWDGIVEDKRVKRKTVSEKSGDEVYTRDCLEYTVFIRSDSGKRHEIKATDNDIVYNYYRIGDKVRHHGGLNSYEKYDKSGDSIIFCNACATLCDINDDTCFRCGCPLLK